MNNPLLKEEKLEEVRAKKEALTALVNSEGWKLLYNFFDAVRVQRRNGIFGNDAAGIDSLIKLGQLKSELAGMEFITSAPAALIEDLNLEEQALLEEMRDELVD